MPLYEYECKKCGKIEETIQKFSDPPLEKCNHCSGKLQKLISNSVFHLKGMGWYVTDYKDKSKTNSSKKSSSKTEKKQKNNKKSKKN